MNQAAFYKKLLAVTEPGTITLKPGPIRLKVSQHDAMAAKALLWLFDQMPDNTVGDLLDVLSAMEWWASFWASLDMGVEVEDLTTRENCGIIW